MINKLISNIRKTNAPIVVGLDPMLNYIPEHIQKKAFAEFGETLEGAAEAIWQYNKGIVDATFDLIPAVKPQIAMYEQFGIPGLIAYKKTVEYCKSKDLVVIGDIKRGDIGSTSAAYAVGHLGQAQVGSKKYAWMYARKRKRVSLFWSKLPIHQVVSSRIVSSTVARSMSW